MRVWIWGALFLVANGAGVDVFKAAVTLPADEALLPRILSIPLIALAALSAAHMASAWTSRDQ